MSPGSGAVDFEFLRRRVPAIRAFLQQNHQGILTALASLDFLTKGERRLSLFPTVWGTKGECHRCLCVIEFPGKEGLILEPHPPKGLFFRCCAFLVYSPLPAWLCLHPPIGTHLHMCFSLENIPQIKMPGYEIQIEHTATHSWAAQLRFSTSLRLYPV